VRARGSITRSGRSFSVVSDGVNVVLSLVERGVTFGATVALAWRFANATK
jgi:hypothetical protein